MDDLQRGVTVEVDDPDGAVRHATVFLPDDLPSYEAVTPQLASSRVAVLQPGEGGYDVVVVYRTGPYCGLLPSVGASADGDALHVTVEVHRGQDCDDMEYDEAVGIDLDPRISGAVTAELANP